MFEVKYKGFSSVEDTVIGSVLYAEVEFFKFFYVDVLFLSEWSLNRVHSILKKLESNSGALELRGRLQYAVRFILCAYIRSTE